MATFLWAEPMLGQGETRVDSVCTNDWKDANGPVC